jgi:hypothetical protein
MSVYTKEQRSLKKKSSSLGVELQALVIDDTEVVSYGAPSDTESLMIQSETAKSDGDQNVPRAVQLMRPENLAISMCYLCVGLMQGT